MNTLQKQVKIFLRGFLTPLISLLIIAGTIAGICGPMVKPGDTVFAEWRPNSWYHGKIKEACDLGWFINFDDGDVKCCAPNQVVKDEVPSPSKLRKGIAVLAEWTDGKYYPGIIASDSPPEYMINFDDGDKRTVAIQQIRLR